jgi:glycosyltransferase involved in cell wall biosynthesis
MNKPEVSVIIPTHNYAQYIRQALDSVFNQTYKDYEIIVVDDGSQDSTREIMLSYGDRIRYYYQENQGPAKARNKGIIESRGKYIAFLDADDIWFPSKLAKQIEMFKTNSRLGMVLTDNSLFDDAGVYKEYVGKKNYLFNGDIVANIFIRSGVVTPTVMVKRDVFDKVGLFEENLWIGEDDNMWIRIAVEYEVNIVDESLANIRDHRNRTIRVNDKFIENVEENIRLLTTKYGQKVAEKIIPHIPGKCNQLYFNEGYKYFEIGDNPRARQQFYKAIHYKHWHWKAYSYIAITFIPARIMSILKSIKRRLLPASLSSPKWTRA